MAPVIEPIEGPIDGILEGDSSTLTESDSDDSSISIDMDEPEINQTPPPLSVIMQFKKPERTINHYYDTKEWSVGERFICRVGYIFDPSKFYIVSCHTETDALQSYIYHWYKDKCEEYLIPSSDVKRDMYCVVYTDGAYYRGYIKNIPDVVSTEPMARVYLLDFGYTLISTFNCLFYMNDDLYTVPTLAIRALLSEIRPYKTTLWSSDAVKKFGELVSGELLTCVVKANHAEEKTLYVKLYRADKRTYLLNVGGALLQQRLALPIVKKKGKMGLTLDNERRAGVFVSKLRFTFMFPSHGDIENCDVPYDQISFQTLTECPGSAKLFSPYFHYMK